MTNCDKCDGTGWKPVAVDGVRRMVVCDCKVRARTDAAKRPTFTPVGELMSRNIDGLLSYEERRIRDLIAARRGRANAISIKDIQAAIAGQLSERDVKAAVEKLRVLGRIPIAATKVAPYGYFIPATAEESDDCHDRLFREGVKLLMLSRLFRPEADLVQELRGQMAIEAEANG